MRPPHPQSNWTPYDLSSPIWKAVLGMQTNASPGRRRVRLPNGDCIAEQSIVPPRWRMPLDDLDSATDKAGIVASDLVQLRGLAVRQDETATLPVHTAVLGPELGRRPASYGRLTEDFVGRGAGQKLMLGSGLQTTSPRWGYGRHLRFVDQDGWQSGGLWLGINHERWASAGDTPLWFRSEWSRASAGAAAIAEELGVRRRGRWIPVHLIEGVAHGEVPDGATAKLKSIARLKGAGLPDDQYDGRGD